MTPLRRALLARLRDVGGAMVTDEMVQPALDAWENVYEGQIEFGAAAWTDNRRPSMRAALEAGLAALEKNDE